MSGHTKGPWIAKIPRQENLGESHLDGTPYYFIDPVRTDDLPPSIQLHISGFFSHADAHLIAAAPDLLQACEIVAQIIREGEGVEVEFRFATELSRALSIITAAIAKAETKS